MKAEATVAGVYVDVAVEVNVIIIIVLVTAHRRQHKR